MVTIIERPLDISFDEIHDVIYAAHESNRNNGINFFTASLTGDQIKERIGDKGKCYVALCDDKVVGTISASVSVRNEWYCGGKTVSLKMLAILPEYKGKHIASLLISQVMEYAQNRGAKCVILDTAEQNQHAIDIYLKKGFLLVDYLAPLNADHYSVVCIYNFDFKAINKLKYTLYFNLKKIYTRIRFKPHHIKRFGI